MKTNIVLALVAAFAITPSVNAAGDLSRANITEVVVEMGTTGKGMYFKPSHLTFETGKAYKMVLKNVDKIKHELDAPGFVQRVFTRKVEVLSASNKMLAEIKGNVREIEVAGGGTVEWFFVPVQTGKSLPMECAIAGHKEAGMVGTITIK
jgi:uncharacterized cupredoxin-like copper-binding protein